MKKSIIILVLTMAFLFSACQKPEPLYQGRLKEIQMVELGGIFGGTIYMATFNDGRVFKLDNLPKEGFKIGAVYDYYYHVGCRYIKEVK